MANFTETPVITVNFQRALSIVCEWHQKQVRKDGRTPYLAHLLTVASLVLEGGGNEQTAIAALFHDTLEDVKEIDELDLTTFTNEKVCGIVKELTDDKTLSKEVRKQAYVDRIPNMSDEAIRICLADKLHNLRGIAMGTAPKLVNDVNKKFYEEVLDNLAKRFENFNSDTEILRKQLDEAWELTFRIW